MQKHTTHTSFRFLCPKVILGEKGQASRLCDPLSSTLQRGGHSSEATFTDIQQFLRFPAHSLNLILTTILLRTHHLLVIKPVSPPQPVQQTLMPPVIPQDTALPLKVKDGRSILALYPVRLDTNIKLSMS